MLLAPDSSTYSSLLFAAAAARPACVGPSVEFAMSVLWVPTRELGVAGVGVGVSVRA